MDIFERQNLLEFPERFKMDSDCKEYLSEIKWKGNFIRDCELDVSIVPQEQQFDVDFCLPSVIEGAHGTCQVNKEFSRMCHIYSHRETSTANTLFHTDKFGGGKSFFICFEMTSSTKSFPASYTGTDYGETEKTARLFMHKVR